MNVKEEELWKKKPQIFQHAKNYNPPKILYYKDKKKPHNPFKILLYYNSLTNLSSFKHTSQNISSFKNPHIKNRPIIIIMYFYLGPPKKIH